MSVFLVSMIGLRQRTVKAIPTVANGGNHTTAFTEAARTAEAHKACFNVSKALAAAGVRVLTDNGFFEQVCISVLRLQFLQCCFGHVFIKWVLCMAGPEHV